MTTTPTDLDKSPRLILVTGASWAALTWISWDLFGHDVAGPFGSLATTLLSLLHAAWMLVWIWAIHNFWHQLAGAVLPRNRLPRSDLNKNAPVAVLYLTCDDFDPVACRSCLEQDHPTLRLIICDDSRQASSRAAVDAWVAQCGQEVQISRRSNRRGFKAGNLNHAIENCVEEEFIVVCDADEIIPTDFVSRLLGFFTAPSIAFVQASHEARIDCATRFSTILGPTIKLFHDYCLAVRNRFGFVACFGHGVMIRKSAWRAVGGFPEIVSEDLGFASRALEQGLRGLYAREVVAQEAFPPNYRAFIAKYAKIAGGTLEYFQKEFPRLLRSKEARAVEKIDILLTFSYCIGGLVTAANIVGALSLSFIYDIQEQGRLALWILMFWLIGPLTPLVALVSDLCQRPAQALRYLLTAAVAFVSLMPILALRVVGQITGRRAPSFEVTGAVALQPEPILRYAAIATTGGCILLVSVMLGSPALAPLLLFSSMLLSGPLLTLVERDDALGLLGRNCCVLPFITLACFLAWGP